MLDLKRHEEFDPEKWLGSSSAAFSLRAERIAQLGGTLLIQMRQAADLTQEGVANKIGIPVEELDFIERGQTSSGPTFALVIQVAEVCNAKLSILYHNAKEPIYVTDAM
jgi:DNA-binding XRE family transcriptional regulator